MKLLEMSTSDSSDSFTDKWPFIVRCENPFSTFKASKGNCMSSVAKKTIEACGFFVGPSAFSCDDPSKAIRLLESNLRHQSSHRTEFIDDFLVWMERDDILKKMVRNNILTQLTKLLMKMSHCNWHFPHNTFLTFVLDTTNCQSFILSITERRRERWSNCTSVWSNGYVPKVNFTNRGSSERYHGHSHSHDTSQRYQYANIHVAAAA